MTDLVRHSKGIWRSIYIFGEIPEHYKMILWVEKELKRLKVKEYSWCHYGEVKSLIPSIAEKAHLTFRINFPNPSKYAEFILLLSKEKWQWEDHNYDEPLWVKKAYVLGTKLYKEVMNEIKNPDVPLSANFLRLMFHGFFNDAHYNSKEETEFYYFLFQSYLQVRYGISPQHQDYWKEG